jgi:amidase
MKSPWKLVPYICYPSFEATLDHYGPMARTVQDCATLLEVIAGSDGIDDRQPYNWPQGHVKFGQELRKFLDNSPTPETLLRGTKFGIFVDGFLISMTDPNVAAASKAEIPKLTKLGAEVKEISIPFYNDSGLLWMVGMAMVCYFPTLLIF